MSGEHPPSYADIERQALLERLVIVLCIITIIFFTYRYCMGGEAPWSHELEERVYGPRR